MSLVVVRLQKAREDIVEIAAHISLDNPDFAERFLTSLKDSLRLISDNPHIGRVYEISRDVKLRRFRVKKFENYLLFYRVLETQIELVRVIHGARDIPTLFEEK